MERKKNPKLILERKRGQFFLIGLTVSLAFVITAFEWRTPEKMGIIDRFDQDIWDDADVIPITKIPQPKPPPPKPIIPTKIEETKEEVKPPPNLVVNIDETPIEIPAIPELTDEKVEETIFDVVEVMPSPANGLSEFYRFLGQHIKYPKQARRMGVEGRVYVQFIIDEEGNLTHLEVARGIGAGCDEEALRVLALAEPWKPGKQRGRPVKVRMMVPIVFRLQ